MIASARATGAIQFAMTHSMAGGLRQIWDDVAGGLAARGHQVARFVLYPPPHGEVAPADLAEWHHLLTRRPGAIGMAGVVPALVGHLRATRPAAVVTGMPLANVLLPLAVGAARVPTRVFTSHHVPTATNGRLLDRLDGWTGTLPGVAAVISVSDAVAASLAHKSPRYAAKRVTIGNALPRSVEMLIDELRRTPPAIGARRIVALGRLTRQKNYPLLLSALALVPDATLDIVGSGEDEATLRALAGSLGLGDRVRFRGLLPRREALKLAAGADLFVQVSLYEGHSLALIEAARLGLPLIVSDVPEQVEAITAADGTRCGIAVPLDDRARLASAITTVLAGPAARAHWSALARRVAAEASHEAMIDRYEALLAPIGGLA